MEKLLLLLINNKGEMMKRFLIFLSFIGFSGAFYLIIFLLWRLYG